MSWLTGVEWLMLLCGWGIVRVLRNPVNEVDNDPWKGSRTR